MDRPPSDPRHGWVREDEASVEISGLSAAGSSRIAAVAAKATQNFNISERNFQRSDVLENTAETLEDDDFEDRRTESDHAILAEPKYESSRLLSGSVSGDRADAPLSTKSSGQRRSSGDGDRMKLDQGDRRALLREFRKLHDHRSHVQIIRAHAMEARRALMVTTKQYLEAAAKFTDSAQLFASTLQDSTEVPLQCRDLESLFHELTVRDARLETIEKDLYPNDSRLGETERAYHERILGTPDLSPDQSDSAMDMTEPSETYSSLALRVKVPFPSPGPGLTLRGRLSTLAAAATDIKDHLSEAEQEYMSLLKDARQRAEVNLRSNPDQQYVLDTYAGRRARLLQDLAAVDRQIVSVKEKFGYTDSIASLESDTLFDLDQFAEADALIQSDETLHSPTPDESEISEDFLSEESERSEDLLLLLNQPLLNELAGPKYLVDWFFKVPVVQYSSVKLEPRSQEWEFETMTNFVSMWIVRSIQSSWWSFKRISAQLLDGDYSSKALEDYLRRDTVPEGHLPDQLSRSEHLETWNSSSVSEGDVGQPLDPTFTLDSQQNTGRGKRRHSSTNSIEAKPLRRTTYRNAHTR